MKGGEYYPSIPQPNSTSWVLSWALQCAPQNFLVFLLLAITNTSTKTLPPFYPTVVTSGLPSLPGHKLSLHFLPKWKGDRKQVPAWDSSYSQ